MGNKLSCSCGPLKIKGYRLDGQGGNSIVNLDFGQFLGLAVNWEFKKAGLRGSVKMIYCARAQDGPQEMEKK